jgi:hypothetical protein
VQVRLTLTVDARQNVDGVAYSLLRHQSAHQAQVDLVGREALVAGSVGRVYTKGQDLHQSGKALAASDGSRLPATRVESSHAPIGSFFVLGERGRKAFVDVLGGVHRHPLTGGSTQPLAGHGTDGLFVQVENVGSVSRQKGLHGADVAVRVPIDVPGAADIQLNHLEWLGGQLRLGAVVGPVGRDDEQDLDTSGDERSFTRSVSWVSAGVIHPQDSHAPSGPPLRKL